MAKKVQAMVKLQLPAGKATPAPPAGPALGQHGVNIMEFCKAFNAKTSGRDQEGLIIPVVITVFSDRSFTFVTKTPPASILLKRAAGIAKGSGEPNRNKVGKVTEKQVEEIAKLKMPDLNAREIAAAVETVKGTARSMGIEVVAAKGNEKNWKGWKLNFDSNFDRSYRWQRQERSSRRPLNWLQNRLTPWRRRCRL